MAAIFKNRSEIADLLLSRSDLDINAENATLYPLTVAARFDRMEMLRKILLRPDLELNARGERRDLEPGGSIKAFGIAAAKPAPPAMLRMILRLRGGEINVNMRLGSLARTPLIMAAAKGRTESVEVSMYV